MKKLKLRRQIGFVIPILFVIGLAANIGSFWVSLYLVSIYGKGGELNPTSPILAKYPIDAWIASLPREFFSLIWWIVVVPFLVGAPFDKRIKEIIAAIAVAPILNDFFMDVLAAFHFSLGSAFQYAPMFASIPLAILGIINIRRANRLEQHISFDMVQAEGKA